MIEAYAVYMTREWRNAGIGIVMLALIAGGLGLHYWYTQTGESVAEEEVPGQVAGEADDSALIPDGTAVTETVRLNESVRIAGVRINPSEIVEDSRCPTDVQCIQAGTVRVMASVTPRGSEQSEPILFELGVRMTVGEDQVTLVDVSPAPQSGSEIGDDQYVFTFSVIKGAIEYYKG